MTVFSIYLSPAFDIYVLNILYCIYINMHSKYLCIHICTYTHTYICVRSWLFSYCETQCPKPTTQRRLILAHIFSPESAGFKIRRLQLKVPEEESCLYHTRIRKRGEESGKEMHSLMSWDSLPCCRQTLSPKSKLQLLRNPVTSPKPHSEHTKLWGNILNPKQSIPLLAD